MGLGDHHHAGDPERAELRNTTSMMQAWPLYGLHHRALHELKAVEDPELQSYS
jgi:hypothetical protein